MTTSRLLGLRLAIFAASEIGVVLAGFGSQARAFSPRRSGIARDRVGDVKVGESRRRRGRRASAGTGADVDEASTLAQGRGDLIDGAGNWRERAADGSGDGCVFFIDQRGDFPGRFLVEVAGGGVGLLGYQGQRLAFACGSSRAPFE